MDSVIRNSYNLQKEVEAYRPSLLQALQHNEAELTSHLNDVQLALKALRDHPEVAETLELVRRATR